MSIHTPRAVIIGLCSMLIFGYATKSLVKEVYAHPGNTASDGCHYCRTNCDYWGEVYGERHCHGGGIGGFDSTPSLTQQGITNGANHAESVNRQYIESNAANEGRIDGNADGGSGKVSVLASDSASFCSQDVEFSSPQSQTYANAFQSTYRSHCYPIYNTAYSSAYMAAYNSARNTYEADKTNEAALEDSNPEGSANSGWYWAGGVAAFYGAAILWETYGAEIKKWFDG